MAKESKEPLMIETETEVKEPRQKPSGSTRFWVAIAFGVIILFLLILISSIIDIGERLANIHEYVAYGFYVVAFLLTYLLVINPVRIILVSPAFSIETVMDNKPTRRRYLTYKRVSKNLLDRDEISQTEKEKLKEAIDDPEALQKVLNEIYSSTMKKKMNKVIMRHAKTVLISTAISQNGRLDLFTVVVVNIRMIKELVQMCGFRPSYKNLAKLTINVFTTALIAEGLENINLNDILPTSTANMLGEIPLIKPVMSSVAQGITNGLLTIRIGVVTRKYLFADSKELSRKAIQKGAFMESLKMIPIVVKDSIIHFPQKFFDMFKRNKEDESTDF
ncbi:YcjF family protein [Acholeplasma vituli]|uniref:YcjF family protein n=1 Tax=Paracholeplasma vituli TaxID=69473 RepID=A0ABT2PZG7_9MOLU|nr:YcjF family protein [Paracholeplasma vituli]MCU0105053.1 YcjF family protein [Paracholeplasma vituli]